MGKPSNKCFIYARISQDRSGAGLNAAQQVKECRELAEARGLEVVEVFVDNDISASKYSTKKRPAFLEMLSRMGEVDAVVAWHLDRVYRKMRELEDFIDASENGGTTKNGVVTFTVSAGDLDLSTASGRMVARVHAAAAAHESEHKAKRIESAHRRLAEAGLWRGGPTVPLGYRKSSATGVLELDPEVAPHVAKAYSDFIAGASAGSIARRWNELGLKALGSRSRLEKSWSHDNVRATLAKPVNAGLSVHNGVEVGKMAFPSIVSEAVYRAAMVIMEDSRTRDAERGRDWRAKHMLAEIAQCWCGSQMKVAYPKHGPSFLCRNMGDQSVKEHAGSSVEEVDALVNQVAAALWANAKRVAGVSNLAIETELVELNAELISIDARVKELGGLFARGVLPASQLEAVGAELAGVRQDLLGKIADAELRLSKPVLRPAGYGPSALESDDGKEWLALPVEDKRAFIRSHLNVVIMRRKGMTPGSRAHLPLARAVVFALSGERLLPVERVRQMVQLHIDAGLPEMHIFTEGDVAGAIKPFSAEWFAMRDGVEE